MALMIAAANYAPLKVRLIAQAKLRRPYDALPQKQKVARVVETTRATVLVER